jgi:hypothetical protein
MFDEAAFFHAYHAYGSSMTSNTLQSRAIALLGALSAAPLLLGLAAFAGQMPSRKVDFTREIEPVLKAHCVQCHGDAKSDGGLRLDSRAAMVTGGSSGAAMQPGAAGKSLLVARLLGHGGKPRMPLGFAPLDDRKVSAIRRWIDQGAVWPDARSARSHWAYTPPMRPKVPLVTNRAWVRNPIDAFVLKRLEREGLKPSTQADRNTLIRRVTLDLTGLPPTPTEVDAFLKDPSSDAYEKVVERLLVSPHYGERMALPWLDAARYADSNGFQQDGDTYQYVWRDWVVRALNANMPFDQFTIEQLAGDLLPNATLDQKVATGFNRCHLLNGEGGAIPEEQRNVILFDRVDVTATNWLGATVACAQCHNHKYDPYTQKDYYRFMAFFNNVPETGTPPFGGQYRIADPWIYAGSKSELARLAELESKVTAAQAELKNVTQSRETAEAQLRWEAAVVETGPPVRLGAWQSLGPFLAEGFDAAYETAFITEKRVDLAGAYLDGRVKWTARPEWADGRVTELSGENSATYLYRTIQRDGPGPLAISLGSDDAVKVWLNGQPVLAKKVMRAALPDQERIVLDLKAGQNELLLKIVNGGGIAGFYFKPQESILPDNIRAIRLVEPAKRTPAQTDELKRYFLANYPPPTYKEARDRVTAREKEREDYRSALPRVMVMSDERPRKTHVLVRGNYEQPSEEVKAGTPEFLGPMPQDVPKNRLGLAKWLVSKENPLTARVQVNRFWQTFFGVGLVKTSENLGTQCEPPLHKELLDWLAVEFWSSGWDTKHIVRLIVTSATYRQSSKVTAELIRRDPENKLFARGARFRMSSMLLRDVALATSGLLNHELGGKPVYPYQPKGIWDGLAITMERDFTFPQSKGKDLFRRSLYTFWRRTVAPANMFDAPARQTCTVRASLTSTPLHALTTLNDVTWVEAGRALAERVLKEAGPDTDTRLSEAYFRVCSRRPGADEIRILKRSLQRSLAAFRADLASAKAYLKAGESPRDETLDVVEHAAFASVCLAIYNLDEALTRE